MPAFLNVVDIAGLVKGAHEGQGLGNAFLSNISACDAIFHMSRKYLCGRSVLCSCSPQLSLDGGCHSGTDNIFPHSPITCQRLCSRTMMLSPIHSTMFSIQYSTSLACIFFAHPPPPLGVSCNIVSEAC